MMQDARSALIDSPREKDLIELAKSLKDIADELRRAKKQAAKAAASKQAQS
jgi:hypothetical protein